MRKEFQLTAIEFRQFQRLRPLPGEAFAFWTRAAADRGLDPQSVMSKGATFTALPTNSGKHWCYPLALACKKKAIYTEN